MLNSCMTEPEKLTVQPSTERLLDAAERLVVERGAAHLTLDAVALEAGVSKGGLLYHFPSKAALLAGMINRHLREVDDRARALAGGDTGSEIACPSRRQVGSFLRALLERCTSHPAAGAAVLAAAAGDPVLLGPCQARRRAFLDQMTALPMGFDRAAILMLAVDGLLLSELLHLSPLTAEERERAVAAILKAVEEDGTP